jgi:hypothetical protein
MKAPSVTANPREDKVNRCHRPQQVLRGRNDQRAKKGRFCTAILSRVRTRHRDHHVAQTESQLIERTSLPGKMVSCKAEMCAPIL